MSETILFNFGKIINKTKEALYNIKYQGSQSDAEEAGFIDMINNNFDQIENTINTDLFQEVFSQEKLINALYPVGTYLHWDNNKDPNNIMNGTEWKKVEGGICLITASKLQGSNYYVGNTGGESQVKLMPEHDAKSQLELTDSYCSHIHLANDIFFDLDHIQADGELPINPEYDGGNGYEKRGLGWYYTTHADTDSDEIGRSYVWEAPSNSVSTSGAYTNKCAIYGTKYDLGTNEMYNNVKQLMYTDQAESIHTHTLSISEKNGTPHNNMMPYYAVNIWHRVR